ncbi:MAG: lysoplasmalogenase [Dysgonamonadaceae bacterium]|nr:lysoplasmalogenase [Dysgonamonadaceae bacterium]
MNSLVINRKWIYGLILAPAISSILALQHYGFIFNSSSAGFGILIFLFLYIKKHPQTKDILILMLAFAFSIVGDWFLSNKHGNTDKFIYGIVFFFFAHVGYLLYALINGNVKWKFSVILLALYLLFFILKLLPTFNNLIFMLAVLIYLIVSCFSLGVAVGLKGNLVSKWGYVFGIFLILFSDTIIAYKEFIGYQELNFLILPTYYLAHISIVFSLMKRYVVESEKITE